MTSVTTLGGGERLRATVAAVCFQSPSKLYSDHHT